MNTTSELALCACSTTARASADPYSRPQREALAAVSGNTSLPAPAAATGASPFGASCRPLSRSLAPRSPDGWPGAWTVTWPGEPSLASSRVGWVPCSEPSELITCKTGLFGEGVGPGRRSVPHFLYLAEASSARPHMRRSQAWATRYASGKR